MNTVKLDKRGRVLIPAAIRKSLMLFEGQKFSIDKYDDKIIIKPYKYVCHCCGANIPDGDEYGCCELCSRKKTKRVY